MRDKVFTFEDHRGIFRTLDLEDALKSSIVQMNLSYSHKNVFRGFHYQAKNPQGKVVILLEGELIDYSIELDHNKDTFGRIYDVHMHKGDFIYIPPKRAHAIEALKESTILYLCTTHYDKESDAGVMPFPIKSHWIMSQRDENFPPFDSNKVYFDQ